MEELSGAERVAMPYTEAQLSELCSKKTKMRCKKEDDGDESHKHKHHHSKNKHANEHGHHGALDHGIHNNRKAQERAAAFKKDKISDLSLIHI